MELDCRQCTAPTTTMHHYHRHHYHHHRYHHHQYHHHHYRHHYYRRTRICVTTVTSLSPPSLSPCTSLSPLLLPPYTTMSIHHHHQSSTILNRGYEGRLVPRLLCISTHVRPIHIHTIKSNQIARSCDHLVEDTRDRIPDQVLK